MPNDLQRVMREIIKLLDACESENEDALPFTLHLLRINLKNLLLNDHWGRRYSKKVIAFASSVLLEEEKGKGFTTLIQTERPFEDNKGNYVHKVTYSMLANAPKIKVALPKFMEWLYSMHNKYESNIILLAHNARFEQSFLQSNLSNL